MARNPENEYRDPETKRYSFYGRFDRVCACGHTLGIHIAGGFECGSVGCSCERFVPAKKPKKQTR